MTSLKPPPSFGLAESCSDLEAAPLRVAGQHPVDVACPERGLVAADALADLDDHVLRVGRVGSTSASFSSSSSAASRSSSSGDELAQLAVAARGVEVGA